MIPEISLTRQCTSSKGYGLYSIWGIIKGSWGVLDTPRLTRVAVNIKDCTALFRMDIGFYMALILRP